MKLHLERPGGHQIEALQEAGVVISGELHTRSLLLFPDHVEPAWPVDDVARLAMEHLALVMERRPGVLLLGCGERTVFPAASVLGALGSAGIGVEVMTTAAAARTYNILLSDGRDVAAALIIRPGP